MRIILENLSKSPDEVIVSVDANETVYYIIYGFASVHKKITLRFTGEGGQGYICGALVGATGDCALSTSQIHARPNTTSDLMVKTVLLGTAKFHYDGVIKIEKDAQKSNAYQRNENLILSPEAHVDTKPELEIIANDVRCTHGATVGRLDEHAIFYLRSRGIPRDEAVALVIRGFLEDVVNRIPDEKAREEINNYLDSELSTKS